MVREISVRIENEPGRIHRVARALGDAEIDITALTVADQDATGVLRIIAADVATARQTLMELDVPATIQPVVAVAAPDTPGGLAAVLAPLSAAHIDIRYVYAFRRKHSEDAVVVLHTDRDEETQALLARAGLELIEEDAVHG